MVHRQVSPGMLAQVEASFSATRHKDSRRQEITPLLDAEASSEYFFKPLNPPDVALLNE